MRLILILALLALLSLGVLGGFVWQGPASLLLIGTALTGIGLLGRRTRQTRTERP